ncbi:MAG: ABC transporter permease [Staphylothermus sp.]|nr:ABC transporter permease [Staphylothermus sp.]
MSFLKQEYSMIIRVVRAELHAYFSWLRNNRLFAFMMIFWPYLFAFFMIGLGVMLGSLNVYAERMGVGNPLFYIIVASGVLVSSLNIMDSIVWSLVDYKWLGVLPYIIASPPGFRRVSIYGLTIPSIISGFISLTSILPAVLFLEGWLGGFKLFIILLIVYIGMLPLVGLGVFLASVTLMLKEESFVGFLSPFMLLVSGVYYPITILPWFLRVIAKIFPVTYVIEAVKVVSVIGTPDISRLLQVIGLLFVLLMTYNLLFFPGVRRAEDFVKKKGVSV